MHDEMKGVSDLQKEGYTVLGSSAGRTLVEKDGRKFYVGKAGDIVAAGDDAKPDESQPPPESDTSRHTTQTDGIF